MSCFHPLEAWRHRESGEVVFSRSAPAFMYESLKLRCGSCIGCRVDYSRGWALRCVHEASMWKKNCFLTLTYDDDHVNSVGSLVKKDFQLFMKRLRKRFGGCDPDEKGRYPIRYFHCGEYGTVRGRPHHHVALFNFDFPEKLLWSEREGVRLYTSPDGYRLWKNGFHVIGDLTYESAAYIARYVMKKVTGRAGKMHYLRVDTETGECFDILPEYVSMSRRPGIGRSWFERFKMDLYNKDFVTHEGRKFRAPAYYDKLYSEFDPEGFAKIKESRKEALAENEDSYSDERLLSREKVAVKRMESLERRLL